MADDRCLNCNETIRQINYAMGKQWMHVNPDAGFPTEHKGSAWRYCKQRIATPTPDAVPSGEATDGTTPTKEA